jgi:small-conductance mechanosensitive channel
MLSEVGQEIEVVVDRWSSGQIGLADVVAAVIVLAVVAVIAWIARRVLARVAKGADGPAATAALVGGQLVSAALYLLGTSLALEIFGFTFGPILILILTAVLGLLLLQPLISNLSAGLLLQFRSPFRPGDLVETGEDLGVVEEVNARTVILVTPDGRTVHVPNREVLEHALTNHSQVGRRRSELCISLPIGADLDHIVERLRFALEPVDHILDRPPAEITTHGFDGSNLAVRVLFWHPPEPAAERHARDSVTRAMAGALEGFGSLVADRTFVVRSSSATDTDKDSS